MVNTFTLRWLHMSQALRRRVAFGAIETGGPLLARNGVGSAEEEYCGVTGLAMGGAPEPTATWRACRP